jgi:hypothetical protein
MKREICKSVVNVLLQNFLISFLNFKVHDDIVKTDKLSFLPAYTYLPVVEAAVHRLV